MIEIKIIEVKLKNICKLIDHLYIKQLWVKYKKTIIGG